MNNYDQSSSGENIDFICFYDTDLAQCYFDEFIEGLDGTQIARINLNRDDCTYLIGDSEKPYFKKSDLNKMSKQVLFDLWVHYDLAVYNAELNDFKKSELITDLMMVTIENHYRILARDYGWNSFIDNITHNYHITRGYSQGDAAIIIFCDADLYTPDYCEYIDHIFWDVPTTMKATINGANYYEDCFLNDPYEYDIDDIKININKLDISDYAKNWLIDNLPDQPL